MNCSICNSLYIFKIHYIKEGKCRIRKNCNCLKDKEIDLHYFDGQFPKLKCLVESNNYQRNLNKDYDFYCRTCNKLTSEKYFSKHKYHDCWRLSILQNSINVDNIKKHISFFNQFNNDFLSKNNKIQIQLSKENSNIYKLFNEYHEMNVKLLEVIQLLYDTYISINDTNPSIEMINLINFTKFNENLKNIQFDQLEFKELEQLLTSQYIIKDFSIDISKSLHIEKTFFKVYNPKDYDIIKKLIILKDGRIAIGTYRFIEIYNSSTYKRDIIVNTGKCSSNLIQLPNGLLLSANKGIKMWKIKHNYLILLGYYFQREDFIRLFFLTKNRILSCLCCNNFSIFNINQPYKLKTYNLPNELSEVNSISSLVQPKGYELAILGTEKGIDFFDLEKRKTLYFLKNIGCFSLYGMKEIPGNKILICSSNFKNENNKEFLRGVAIVNYLTYQIETIFYNFDPKKEPYMENYNLVELEDGTIVMFGSDGGCFQMDVNTYNIKPFRFNRGSMFDIIEFTQRKLICIYENAKIAILNYE